MAGENPVKYSDLVIDDGAIDKLIADLGNANKALTESFKPIIKQAKDLKKALNDIANAKQMDEKATSSLENQLNSLKKKFDDLKKAQDENIKRQDEARAVKERFTKAQMEELAAIRAAEKAKNDEAKAAAKRAREEAKAAKEAERAKAKAITDAEKQRQAQHRLTVEYQQELIAKRKQAQATKEEAILNSKLTTTYEKQVVRLSQIKRELKDLTAQGIKAPKALQKEFDSLDRSVRRSEQSVKENFRSVGNYPDLKSIGTGLLSAAGIGLGVGGIIQGIRGGLDTIREFETAIANLGAITGVSGDKLVELEEDVIHLSVIYGKSAAEIADAVTLVGSKAPELLENQKALVSVTDSALLLSQAGKVSVPEAADAITKALNKFNLPASQAGKVVDILAASSKAGSVEIAQLSEEMGKFGGIAKNSGLTVQQSAAIIEAVGKTVDESGTKIRGILINLASGADKYNPKVVGLQKALDNLAKDGFDNTAKAAKTFGQQNAEAAVQLIQNREEVLKLTEAVDENGVALEQASKNMDTVDGALDRLGSSWDAVILKFRNSKGVIKDIINGLTEYLNLGAKVTDLNKELSDLGLEEISAFNPFQDLTGSKEVLSYLNSVKKVVSDISDNNDKLAIAQKNVNNEILKYNNAIKASNDEEQIKLLRARIIGLGKISIEIKDLIKVNEEAALKAQEETNKKGGELSKEDIARPNKDAERRIALIESERQRALESEKLKYENEYREAVKNGENLQLLQELHRKRILDINTEFNKKEADEFDRLEKEEEKRRQDAAKKLAEDRQKEIDALERLNKEKDIIVIDSAKTEEELARGLLENKIDFLEEELMLKRKFNEQDLHANREKTQETIDLEKQLSEAKRELRNKEAEEDKKRAEEVRDKKRAEEVRRISDLAANKAFETQEKIYQDQLEKNADLQAKKKEQISEQQKLAQEGYVNTLEFQEAQLAKAQAEQNKIQRKQIILEKVKALYSAYSSKAAAGDENALADAFKDVAILTAAEATIQTLSFGDGGIPDDVLDADKNGASSRGSINNGYVRGEKHKTKGEGIPVFVEGGEGIFSSREMNNMGKDNFYRFKSFVGSNKLGDNFFKSQSSFVPEVSVLSVNLSPLQKGLERVERAIENKPYQQVDVVKMTDTIAEIVDKQTSGRRTVVNRYRVNKRRL